MKHAQLDLKCRKVMLLSGKSIKRVKQNERERARELLARKKVSFVIINYLSCQKLERKSFRAGEGGGSGGQMSSGYTAEQGQSWPLSTGLFWAMGAF